MEAGAFPSLRGAPRDLTHAEGFALGPLTVDPPSRRVSAGGRSEMLEPRVMRVLVALGEAQGKVLSRDDLIAMCWDGVVVGGNAINQTISRLRHVFEELSGGAVRLETITKVGFRLVVDGQTAGAAPLPDLPPAVAGRSASVAPANGAAARHRWSRRSLGAGLVAAGAVAALGTAFGLRRGHVPDPRAVELYQRGQAIQKAGVVESMGEAIEAYQQAVAIDPRYADAWAGIAIGHRYPVYGQKMVLSDPREVRVAAGRALALDPDNADARLALIAAYPMFRRWLEREARLRAFLDDHPDSALGHALLANMLSQVGSIKEWLAAARRIVEIDPMRQVGWVQQALALSYLGRNEDADLAVEEARSRWPRDFRMWFLGYHVLIDSKRHAEAILYLRSTTRLPGAIATSMLENLLTTAEALATGQGMAEWRRKAGNAPAVLVIESIWITVSNFVFAGLTDELFALFEAYFFGGVVNGTRVAPPGPLDARPTTPLFAPAVLTLRGDPRYTSLLARCGLKDYWRKSGTQPDFRRQ